MGIAISSLFSVLTITPPPPERTYLLLLRKHLPEICVVDLGVKHSLHQGAPIIVLDEALPAGISLSHMVEPL